MAANTYSAKAIRAGHSFIRAINDFIGSSEAPEDYQQGLPLVEYRQDVEEAIALLERLKGT